MGKNKQVIIPSTGLSTGKSNITDRMMDFLSIKDKKVVIDGEEILVDRMEYLLDYLTSNAITTTPIEEIGNFNPDTGEMEPSKVIEKTEPDHKIIRELIEIMKLKTPKAAEEKENKLDNLINTLVADKKDRSGNAEYEVIE